MPCTLIHFLRCREMIRIGRRRKGARAASWGPEKRGRGWKRRGSRGSRGRRLETPLRWGIGDGPPVSDHRWSFYRSPWRSRSRCWRYSPRSARRARWEGRKASRWRCIFRPTCRPTRSPGVLGKVMRWRTKVWGMICIHWLSVGTYWWMMAAVEGWKEEKHSLNQSINQSITWSIDLPEFYGKRHSINQSIESLTLQTHLILPISW